MIIHCNPKHWNCRYPQTIERFSKFYNSERLKDRVSRPREESGLLTRNYRNRALREFLDGGGITPQRGAQTFPVRCVQFRSLTGKGRNRFHGIWLRVEG